MFFRIYGTVFSANPKNQVTDRPDKTSSTLINQYFDVFEIIL